MAMSEIAGTGFYYSMKPDGGLDFAQMRGDAMEPLDAQTFAQVFGRQVNSKDARKQAQNLLGQMNQSRRTSFTLAPFDDRAEQASQQMNAQIGTVLGG